MKICISSTFIDLVDYRQVALEVCDIFQTKQLAMEIMFSKNNDSIEESLKLVEESDIYICIIGERYGTIQDGYTKSITHLEYDRAIQTKKPIYIFVVESVTRNKKMEVFLNKIKQLHVFSEVNSIDIFRKALLNTLRNNHFKKLKIDSKFIIDLESKHMKLNDHGLAMEFISGKDTLELLNIFHQNIVGMENMLNSIYLSNNNLETDLGNFFDELNLDKTKIDEIPY